VAQGRLEVGRQRALQQVLASSGSEIPVFRANAIEAMQGLPARAISLVQMGLEDENLGVRFTALACMGKMRLKELVPSARRYLEDPSFSVRAAAMFALRRCGEPLDISMMSQMLASNDPVLRSNVAMLVGQMGDRSAAPMLVELARVPMPRVSAVQEAIVRVQVAEAIVRLGDDSALNALRAAAYSQFDEVRVLAVTLMGELGDRRMEKAFADMLLEPPIELQIAAAGTLAGFGLNEGMGVVLEACESDLVTVRAQAAWTLQYYSDPVVTEMLVWLLDDPQEQVRLSAAASILRRPGALSGK
jgi:HEAT repeat protein